MSSTNCDIVTDLAYLRKKTDLTNFEFNPKRVKKIHGEPEVSLRLGSRKNGVIYWMSRDQRVQDNWALIYAQKLAREFKSPLHVVFCLVPKFLDATIRHYDFMIKGLMEVESECLSLAIPFQLLLGEAWKVLPEFILSEDIGFVVTDMSPLRVPKKWVSDVASRLPADVCFHQVDAHNVVPVWEASTFSESQPFKIRPKLEGRLKEFLCEFPSVIKHEFNNVNCSKQRTIDWSAVYESLVIDDTVGVVDTYIAGSKSALNNLEDFVNRRLRHYAEERNDPCVDACSNISPWAHFGQISMQRAILYVLSKGEGKNVDSFVREALVFRELADNFCYYQENYDNLNGAPEWAQASLEKHRPDKRQYLYSLEDFEAARTHDEIWNAAQIQVIKEGKMHGYLRMYWAKKILEWTECVEDALKIALYLNDRYQLDGRDPNGYVGCMWSICGATDRQFPERNIVGKVRWMSYQACFKKFDVKQYCGKYGAKSYPYKPKVKGGICSKSDCAISFDSPRQKNYRSEMAEIE